jgi:hypothetical protein
VGVRSGVLGVLTLNRLVLLEDSVVMLSCLPTIATVAHPYSSCAPRPLPPPGVAMPPRSSRMIVRASSSSRLDRVSLSPHLHSKSIRSSKRQSSSRPRSVSLSPHLHPRTIRPEQSTSRSSSSEEKPTFPPFALEEERSRPATRRGEMRRRDQKCTRP